MNENFNSCILPPIIRLDYVLFKEEVLKLSTKQKCFLRSEAHHLKPLAQVGKNGVTASFSKSTSELLARHELLKIKFNEFKDERKELFATLAESVNGHVIGMVGNTGILYRQHPKAAQRRYTLPN